MTIVYEKDISNIEQELKTTLGTKLCGISYPPLEIICTEALTAEEQTNVENILGYKIRVKQ